MPAGEFARIARSTAATFRRAVALAIRSRSARFQSVLKLGPLRGEMAMFKLWSNDPARHRYYRWRLQRDILWS